MVELEIKPTAAANARVVSVIFAAVLIGGALAFLLTGGGRALFASKSTLYTYVPDAAGLVNGSEVRLSGIPVGNITNIDLSGSLDPQRIVRVEMLVDTSFLRSIPSDSQTSITEDNLVGDQFVSIDEGKSRLPVQPDATLRSEPVKQALENADLVASLQSKVKEVDDLLTQMSSKNTPMGQLFLTQDLYDELLQRITGFDKSLRALAGSGSPFGQALFSDTLYKRVLGYVQQVDNTLAAIQRGEGTAGHFFASDQMYDDFLRDLRDFRKQLADVSAGKGTAGALLEDDADYRKIRKILSQTDDLIAALNAGEGGAGHLLADPQLYESLNGSLRAMEEMIRNFREDPRKYLRVRF